MDEQMAKMALECNASTARELIEAGDVKIFENVSNYLTSLVGEYEVRLPLHSLQFIFHPERWRFGDKYAG